MKENGFFAEFKKFITRGNVLDMAVGVVIGGAFTAIVNSLVKDLINPLIGVVTGGTDFGALKIVLKPASEGVEELAIRYGMFINAIINFLLIALVLFFIVRAFNKMEQKKKEKEEAEAKAKAEAEAQAKAAEPAPKDPEIALLEEIRDLLKK